MMVLVRLAPGKPSGLVQNSQRARSVLAFIGLLPFLVAGCKTSGITHTHYPRTRPLSALPVPLADETPNPEPNEPVKYVKMQKWNPVWWLGNVDDPAPPAWYRPNHRWRETLWQWRNPLHNFMFYVVGIADKKFERVGLFPERVGNPNGGWNWAVCKYKWLRLPFIGYSGNRFNFYAGWRTRGNLGFKFNFEEPRKKEAASPPQTSSLGN